MCRMLPEIHSYVTFGTTGAYIRRLYIALLEDKAR